jgi:ornithine decarboxylase
MSTITVQRTRTAQAATLRLAPQYPSTGSGSRELSQHTAHDLIKVLDPAAPVKYTPAHSLPIAPAAASTAPKKDVLELPDVLDTQIHDLIQQTIADRGVAEGGDESSFFAADLSAVYQAVKMWRASPMGDRVEIFYAAKCCPTVPVLHLLSLLGCSFDCASTNEFQQVLALPSAPSPDRIIFANPCKAPSMIRAAAEAGVEMLTFDNADELYKVKRAYPNAKLVLRILTDDSKSLCRLGLKYGAPLETCPGLLALARQLDLNVVGVSFHVGSGCKDPNQFADAVWRSKKVFDMAKQAGYDLKLLDIGGGFERETFAEMSEVVSDALDVYFPKSSGVRVIAEPGRLLVSSAFTLATNIIARRRALEPAPVQCEADSDGADVMCESARQSLSTPVHCLLQTTSTTASTARSTASCSTTRSSTLTPSPSTTKPLPPSLPSRPHLTFTSRSTCPSS